MDATAYGDPSDPFLSSIPIVSDSSQNSGPAYLRESISFGILTKRRDGSAVKPVESTATTCIDFVSRPEKFSTPSRELNWRYSVARLDRHFQSVRIYYRRGSSNFWMNRTTHITGLQFIPVDRPIPEMVGQWVHDAESEDISLNGAEKIERVKIWVANNGENGSRLREYRVSAIMLVQSSQTRVWGLDGENDHFLLEQKSPVRIFLPSSIFLLTASRLN